MIYSRLSARKINFVVLSPNRQDERPAPLIGPYFTIERIGGPHPAPPPTIFRMDCNNLILQQDWRGSGCLVVVPPQWSEAVHDDPHIEFDGRWRELDNVEECWKITDIFEQLSTSKEADARPALIHPRLLKYLGSDPWTRFPMFEKPPGAVALSHFLSDCGPSLYTSASQTATASPEKSTKSRVQEAYRAMVYHWVLDIVSALSFLHSNGVVIGLLNRDSFLLSSDSPLSSSETPPIRAFLVSFRDACYHSKSNGNKFIHGAGWPGQEFPPPLCDIIDPTPGTDICLLGDLIYRLMTGQGATHGWDGSETSNPELEKEYLGEIVTKCWNGSYGEDIEALKTDLVQFLEGETFNFPKDQGVMKDFVLEKTFSVS